jgi:YfiH family protein
MLELIAAENDVHFIRSSLLVAAGVPHGFTTRLGGISEPPCDTLNLAAPDAGSDKAEAIAVNFDRAKTAIGCAGHQIIRVTQVHGDAILAVKRLPIDATTCADSLVTAERGKLLCIRVADCVPILLAAADADGTIVAVAAVHAGWRGITANILAATIQRLVADHDVSPGQLIAAVGPCIRVKHFEVGHEVAEAFEMVGLASTISRTHGPKPHLDLTEAARIQLLNAGVDPQNIDTGDFCTFADARLFFSHRRDHGKTGRLAAMIAMPQ